MGIDHSKQTGKKITTRGTKKVCIHVEDILYIQYDRDFATIFLNNNTKVNEIKTLKAYEEELCDLCFIRISRNTIINGKYITNVDSHLGKNVVYLENNIALHISKRRLRFVKEQLY
jgi:DNA-binding LytR/AlgR family response regulator